jgi:DNA-directed RNA polymerase subunit H (RpoH/RPB5)
MPLSSKENLVKNNKIIKEQIKEHLNILKEYHIKQNIQLPQIYIDLFAKHLDAGIPLEPALSNK